MIKYNLSALLEKKGNHLGEIVEKLSQRYWHPRQEREKRGIIVAVLLVVATSYFWGIWKPVNSEISQQRNVQQQLKQLQLKLEVWNKSRKAGKSAPAEAENMADYFSKLITERAEKLGVVIESVNAEENIISVELKPVEFTLVLRWLNQLREEEGFMVSNLAVIATTPGVIAVQRLELFYQP